MYTIAICDDDGPALCEADRLCREILEEAGISCRTDLFQSAGDLLAALESGARFDLLLLDVMMDGLNGMTLAEELRSRSDQTPIVFMSSHVEMAMRGYHVSALRFLPKPLTRDTTREALLFCYARRTEKREILVPTNSGQSRISCSDLMYAEAWNRGVRLALTDGVTETRMKFSELIILLPEQDFVQCHRAYVVGLRHVQSLGTGELVMRSGVRLPVSRNRAAEVERRFVNYLSI